MTTLAPLPHPVETLFPKLAGTNYRETSKRNPRYNCVAWIFDDHTQWWQCMVTPIPRVYWPPDAPQHDDLDAYVGLFAARGYVQCTTPDLETGYEKIAIYEDPHGGFGHVAWQQPDGTWSSKLGKSYDIAHERLDVLEGNGMWDYGTARIFLKRTRRSTRACPA